MGGSPRLITTLCSLAVLLVISTATGQTELERFQRQLELIERQTRVEVDTDLPVDQRIYVDYGGIAGFSFLAIDDNSQETHILRQYDLTGYGRVSIDGVHELFARVRTTYRDFNRGDSFDGKGDDWVEPTLDRGFYRLNLGRWTEAYEGERRDFDLTVKVGRQLVHWANGLTLSQTIDGGVVHYGQGPLGLTGVGGITRRSSTDFDSSRPGFDGDMKRVFAGGRLSWKLSPRHRPYVYGLAQIDENDDATFNTLGTTTRFEYDSYYIGAGSEGSFGDSLVYGLEVVYQGGEGLSNSFDENGLPTAQTTEDIHAWAADVRLDYLLLDANRTRLSAELLAASGDSDRGHTSNTLAGNQPGTDDNAFNAFGLVNTGLAFAPDPSNLLAARAGVSTYPFAGGDLGDRFQVGTDLFWFGKQDRDGGFTEATTDDVFLGVEADLFANWQITSDLSWALRYGVFIPGTAIRHADEDNDDDPRHFFYSGVTLTF